MVGPALTLSIAFLVIQMLDPFILGWQAINRPIVVGPIIGLLLGDLKTGIILGASLESIFMGISAVGGAIPSDPTSATIITVAFTILLGENTDAGLALAIPIGTAIISINGLTTPIFAALAPYWERVAVSGRMGKFFRESFFVTLVMSLVTAIVLFLAVAYGLEGLNSLLATLPAWVMTGLGAASGMMLGIGIAILTSMIWTNTAGVFFFLGYVLIKFFSLSTLPVAVIGIVIAVAIFFQDKQIIDLKNALQSGKGSKSATEEGFFA